jgi:hypothetical protein
VFALLLFLGWCAKVARTAKLIARSAKRLNRAIALKVNLRSDGEEDLVTVEIEEEDMSVAKRPREMDEL